MSYDPYNLKVPEHHHGKSATPVYIIKAPSYSRQPKPKPRTWIWTQVSPLINNGLTPNATLARSMLNLSRLPADADPDACLAWARAFCDSIDCGTNPRTAASIANRTMTRNS